MQPDIKIHPREIDTKEARIAIYDAIASLSEEDTIHLFHYVELLTQNQNNSLTPVQDFIVGLPWHWKLSLKHGDGLTPDDIVSMVNDGDGCRSWFNDAVAITRHFNKYYSEAIAKTPEDAEGEDHAA